MRSLCFLVLTGLVWAQSPVKVTRQATPEKALIFEVDVPASRAAVWEAFSTSQGLSTWLAPQATVDLRQGGDWIVHFPGSTGGGTILSFEPMVQLTIAALAPDQFPTVRAQRTTARFEFSGSGNTTSGNTTSGNTTSGNTTKVRLIQTGWKQGAEWDKAYEYLADGNVQLLEALRQRFVSGPIDWAKLK